ncbi:hypothetical protein Leryth_022657 [Lithospermum erythrorhizon]|nr:hypothetical protein Leryth_022657 [Lithospermum erythrorhizon]
MHHESLNLWGFNLSICHGSEDRMYQTTTQALCNLSCLTISAIESLLLLLKDNSTRQKVFHLVLPYLVDLVELSTKSSKGGQLTTKAKYGQMVFVYKIKSNLGNKRRKNDNLMSPQEFRQRKLMETRSFGQVRYRKTNAEFCPMKLIKERIVLYSNRSQCYLLLKEPK